MILQCESRRCVLRFTAYLRELSIDRNILDDRVGAIKRRGKRFIGIPAQEYGIILLRFGCCNRTAGHNGNRVDGCSAVGIEGNRSGLTKGNICSVDTLDQIQQVIQVNGSASVNISSIFINLYRCIIREISCQKIYVSIINDPIAVDISVQHTALCKYAHRHKLNQHRKCQQNRKQ